MTTGKITKIENTTLAPVFGDILASSTTAKSKPVNVDATVTAKKVSVAAGDKFTATAALAPAVSVRSGTVQVWAGRQISATKFAGLHRVGSYSVKVGVASKKVSVTLAPGTWHVQLRYTDKGVLTTGKSGVKTVTVR